VAFVAVLAFVAVFNNAAVFAVVFIDAVVFAEVFIIAVVFINAAALAAIAVVNPNRFQFLKRIPIGLRKSIRPCTALGCQGYFSIITGKA
jgi:hypothetical protein